MRPAAVSAGRGEESRKRQRQRQYVGVDKIIGRGACLRSGQIAEHGKVGREQEHAENRPGKSGVRVKGDGNRERGEPFEPQQQTDTAGDKPDFAVRHKPRTGQRLERRYGCEHRNLLVYVQTTE